MSPLPKRTLKWMLKVKSSYKSKLRNGNKTVLEPKFFSICNLVKFKKLGFSAPLSVNAAA